MYGIMPQGNGSMKRSYYNIFTKESIKRAREYANMFQYGCHLLSDKDIMDILGIMAEKIRDRQNAHYKKVFDNINKSLGIKTRKIGMEVVLEKVKK
jgi:hypothetical protein